jgi:hypothetical protein
MNEKLTVSQVLNMTPAQLRKVLQAQRDGGDGKRAGFDVAADAMTRIQKLVSRGNNNGSLGADNFRAEMLKRLERSGKRSTNIIGII